MGEILHQVFMGLGSLAMAPVNALPRPGYHLTLPPENATQAIAFDFSMVSKDLANGIDQVENEKQLELKLNP